MTTSGTTPQYQQIADTLRRRIARAEYAEGDLIPPSTELEQTFDVSNITIRKALALLSEDGWITGRRGIGTVVNAVPRDLRLKIAVSGDFSKWVDTASGKSLPIRQKVFDFQVIPGPKRETMMLGLGPASPLWTLRRLRWIKDEIISCHINYARPDVMADCDASHMAGTRNFVDLLREDCGLVLKRMDQTVEATATDRDLADLLQVSFGTPLFFVENIYTDVADTVVAVSHLYLRGDHYAHQTSIDMVGKTK